ncbi:MAG: tryptophan-rich sensory protein [Candidatus Thorarchaeota archaeon]|nr:MAG: tryptophan-rich sensory protein [Candidatus Thorarchaeota archaeon]
MTDNFKNFQVINVIAVVFTIVMNALANILPFNGVTTGTVSDSYPNYFTPPGYVFSIWGAIYVLLFVFVFYQAKKSQVNETYLGKIGYLYLIGAILNVAWLILFHYSYGNTPLLVLSEFLIIGFLVVLLLTYVRLGIGIKEVSLRQKLAIHLPTSVYVGWISLATIANTASVLNAYLTITVDVQVLWTALVLVVALLLSTLMIVLRRDIAYGLVVIWASVGIASKWISIPLIFNTAIIVAVVVALLILIVPIIRKKNWVDYYLVRRLE